MNVLKGYHHCLLLSDYSSENEFQHLIDITFSGLYFIQVFVTESSAYLRAKIEIAKREL